MTATAPTPAPPSQAPAAAPRERVKKEFEPQMVHAYRRTPYMLPDKVTGLEKEHAVPVTFMGETVKFMSNDEGHVVGLVKTKALFDRLTKEIAEAYIPYKNGENVPERKVEEPANKKPQGDFVLQNSDGQFVVLDTMEEADLRKFVRDNGGEELPELELPVLRQAVFNIFSAQ